MLFYFVGFSGCFSYSSDPQFVAVLYSVLVCYYRSLEFPFALVFWCQFGPFLCLVPFLLFPCVVFKLPFSFW